MGESFAAQLKLLPDYLGHHLLLTLIALITGILVCVPLGLLVTRVKALQWPTLAVASVLQTIPGIALLALMVPLLGKIGLIPALLALIIYSFLPILRNTVTGVLNVDSSVVEAARGLGMSDRQILYKIELPLALPVLIAGIRTATVWVVGTATLATPVGATSLGNFVFSGLQTQNVAAIIVGCVAAALLAIVLDQLVRLIEIATSGRNGILGAAAIISLLLLIGAGLSPMIINASGSKVPAQTIVVGSKPFTEQYILAQTISDRLRESGFKTDIRSGMGSMVLFEAMENGEIDCYVDYTGTIWSNVMKRKDVPSRKEVLQQMTAWLRQKHDILCLGPLGFENTYGLAVREEDARAYRLTAIADLTPRAPELLIGSDYEFFLRPEWESLRDSYHLDFKKKITMDPVLMYRAISQGEVDVISAYSTDGRIAAYGLVVLEDPRQALPPYDAVLLLSSHVANHPELTEALGVLIAGIDDDSMRQANKLVDLDGVSVDSAAAFLRNGFEPGNF
ncbi:MAG: ABC transporter permease subunit [candidate division Zixibacteria bacterium]|nr:ABC transporter permease subunit [candidate division Zixibacteria bacterium]